MRTALGLICCALICWGALAISSTPAPEEASALALFCNVTSTCLVCTDELQVTEHSHCQKTGYRQELECLADDADASHNSQVVRKLPQERQTAHTRGKRYQLHQSCDPGGKLGLIGFECICLAGVSVSVPVILWRKSRSKQ